MSAIYLDSCIVIYLIEGPDSFREACYRVLANRKDLRLKPAAADRLQIVNPLDFVKE